MRLLSEPKFANPKKRDTQFKNTKVHTLSFRLRPSINQLRRQLALLLACGKCVQRCSVVASLACVFLFLGRQAATRVGRRRKGKERRTRRGREEPGKMPVYAKALYDFPGFEEGDLYFQEDDIIEVTDQEDAGWWTGVHQDTGAAGDFPFNYVEIISAEEAESMQALKHAKPAEFSFQGDKIVKVKVSGGEVSKKSKTLKFTVTAEMEGGKKRQTKKSISQLRDLDVQVKAIFPDFKGSLPPVWADHAGLTGVDARKREEAIEAYLSKFIGKDASDYLLLVWLFPGETVKVSAASEELVAAGTESQNAGRDRMSKAIDVEMKITPTLALVEFTWMPQDDQELYVEEDQLIAVLSQETGSPGWWQAQSLASGSKGLIPFNHVELLDTRVAEAILMGTPVNKALDMKFDDSEGGYAEIKREKKKSKRISLFSGKNKKKGDAAPSDRQKKFEAPFTLSSIESFDRLLDTGFTMEKNGKMVGTSASAGGPKPGAFVRLEHTAYLWQEQKQALVELGATDMPSKLHEGGLLEFFVGNKETIKGIDSAVMRMSLNDEARVIMTPQFAYGKAGIPPDVPPNATLVYDLKLVEFGTDGMAAPKIELDTTMPSQAAPAVPTSVKPASLVEQVRSSGKPKKPANPMMQQIQDPPTLKKPTPPKAPSMPQGGPPKPPGEPMSLQEAIALRRKKLEEAPQQVVVTAPIADHSQSNVGRASIRKPQPPQPKFLKPDKQFGLEELQAAVRDGKVVEMNLDGSVLEDYLNDDDFERAFKMPREEFLLKPRWRQQALKKGVGLF